MLITFIGNDSKNKSYEDGENMDDEDADPN